MPKPIQIGLKAAAVLLLVSEAVMFFAADAWGITLGIDARSAIDALGTAAGGLLLATAVKGKR